MNKIKRFEFVFDPDYLALVRVVRDAHYTGGHHGEKSGTYYLTATTAARLRLLISAGVLTPTISPVFLLADSAHLIYEVASVEGVREVVAHARRVLAAASERLPESEFLDAKFDEVDEALATARGRALKLLYYRDDAFAV